MQAYDNQKVYSESEMEWTLGIGFHERARLNGQAATPQTPMLMDAVAVVVSPAPTSTPTGITTHNPTVLQRLFCCLYRTN